MKTVVVADSASTVPFRRGQRAVHRALDHLGFLYETVDLSWVRLSDHDLGPVHLLVVGQEGIGKALSGDEITVILRRVSQGMGLVILDGYLSGWPREFVEALGTGPFAERKTGAVRAVPGWIAGPAGGREFALNSPLPACPLTTPPAAWTPILTDEEGSAAAVSASRGRGRIVLFCLSAGLWQPEHLGHLGGLDGVFRRSLVWAARKPFVINSMPPFVTARIDDVSASGSPVDISPETVRGLRWLEPLTARGFIPNLGLFVDDIGPADAEPIKRAYYDGRAEFSPHAFSDPRNANENPVYLKHTGEEFPTAELADRFERVDNRFASWNIKPSRTVNAHFGEVGLNALSLLKQRGQTHMMNICRVGKAYADPKAHHWDLKPYGKIHFCLDRIPEDRDFFNCVSAPGADFSADRPDFDFLCGCTRFWNEAPATDAAAAVRRGAAFIEEGLENTFFGCLFTHEQRIAALEPSEWETIVSTIAARLTGPFMFKSYDYISAYAENRTRCELVDGRFADELTLSVKGESRMPQLLHLFLDGGEAVRQSFLEIPPFEKATVLSFRI